MKALIIPDVHQKVNWKFALQNVNNFDKIFFLGDYFDYHDNADVYGFEAITNFEEIIAFKKKYPDKVELCFGNHDAHYLGGFRCYSNWQMDYGDDFCEALLKAADYLNICYRFGDYIISHAGITKTWYETWTKSIPNWPNIKKCWLTNELPKVGEDPIENINSWFKYLLKCNVSLMDDMKYKTLSVEEKSNLAMMTNHLGAIFEFPLGCRDSYGDSEICPPTWVRPYSLLRDALFDYQIVGHSAVEAFFSEDGLVFPALYENNHVIFIDNVDHNNLYIIDDDIKIEWKELKSA